MHLSCQRREDAAPDKEDYTAHNLQALELSIRLRAMYQFQEEQYEE